MTDMVHLMKFARTLACGSDWQVKLPSWAVLQLDRGVLYARSGETSQELPPLGLVIIPPKSAVTLLASVLGEAHLHGFSVHVGSLSGLVTAAERRCLEKDAAPACTPFRLVPALHPLADRLAQCFGGKQPMSLTARLGFLHAFAEWLNPWLAKAGQSASPVPAPRPKDSLQQFINQMPESELIGLSLKAVADHLRCCERHTSRLFHEVYGCGFRKYISDLRMQKACQMLADRSYKIIDVALESGHSSLALFNYSFKNRYHMTPTEWRERLMSR